MIVAVDTSAVIAFLQGEQGAEAILACLGRAQARLVSSGTYLECSIVARRTVGGDRLRLFLEEAGIEIAPFGAQDAIVAAEAYHRFGKGSGHPAQLNFGDCFSYALARTRDLPLLYKGNDFSHTDIRPALDP